VTKGKILDEATLTDSMADLIKEIAETLRSGIGNYVEEHRFRRGSLSHGAQRVEVGFDIEEVVSEYNIL